MDTTTRVTAVHIREHGLPVEATGVRWVATDWTECRAVVEASMYGWADGDSAKTAEVITGTPGLCNAHREASREAHGLDDQSTPECDLVSQEAKDEWHSEMLSDRWGS